MRARMCSVNSMLVELELTLGTNRRFFMQIQCSIIGMNEVDFIFIMIK